MASQSTMRMGSPRLHASAPEYRRHRGGRASGLQLDDFVDDAVVGDALAVPVVVQVRALHGGGDEVGVKDRHALPALAAHAVVDDAVRAGAVPAARRVLAGGIAVRIVQLRPAAADVMEAAL